MPHRHLVTLNLEVDFAKMTVIGATPNGLRRIAPVVGGAFSSERLNGVVQPGADWVLDRHDGVMEIDVRLVLETFDLALIYLSYSGRFLAGTDARKRFKRGELLQEEEYSLVINTRFECGHDRYSWLNNTIAVGVGTQTLTGPSYQIFEIGNVV